MKFLKSKKIIYLILVMFLLAVFSFSALSKNKKTLSGIDLKKAQSFSVKKGNIAKTLIFSGKIDAENFAVLRFQTSGQLAWLGVKEGNLVKKWQAVASLDKESLKKSLQKEMNDYLTSRWNFEDTQDLYKETKERKLITDEIKRILDRQQFTLNNSVLDYEIGNLTVKYATLISPLDGIITDIENQTVGVNVTPLNFSVTVIDPSSIYFKSEVDEEDVKYLSEKQNAIIVIDTFSDLEINSILTGISFTPIEGQSSTTYKIKFSLPLDNSELKYRAGMNGDAKIVLEKKENVPFIPIDSYLEEGEKKYVYLKDPKSNKISRQEIKTGLESDEEIEVIDGLSEGQTIVY